MAKDKKPSKATLSGTEELHRMREKIRKQDAQIAHAFSSSLADLKRERDAAKAANAKKKKLIPRPKGQAGRSTGYNLQAEMGLDGNKGSKTRYNRLMRIVKDNVHQHLSVQKTLSKQHPKTLEQTIALNRRRRDLRKEKEADERDARGDVNEDESSDDDIEDLEEDGSDQEAEPPRAPKRKSNAKRPVAKKRVDSESDLADADDEEEDEDTFHKKQDDKKDDSQTRRRAPLAERSSQQVQINSRVIRSLSSPELPSGCPVKDCLDYVPEESSRRLLYLFSERHHLIREGADGSELADLQICAALEQQKDVTRFIKLGRQNNWPQIIDYPAVIDRILSLRKILLALIRHEELLLKCDIWNALLQTIDYKICEFSASSHKKDYVYAMYERRCGYYGPQGQLLINSTIAQMLWDDEEDLSYDLCNTLHNVISADRDKYDDVDDSRDHLMPLDAFIFFVLTPFTAVLLIAQDMKVDLDKAGDIRDASSEFGDVIQPLYLDDLMIRELHEKNLSSIGSGNAFLGALWTEERAKAGSVIPPERQKIKLNREILSLTDFTQIQSVKPGSTTEIVNSPPPNTKGRKSNKRKMLSLDEFEEPDITEKTAKTSRKKAPKAKRVTLDDFVEPDPEPPKKKSKKEPVLPKQKAVKENPVKSDYRTRARARKADE
ncbi:hypothetical protein C8R45DRAFT_1181175 [Mycena sanguinolenta]|nr:hypothetical protein C8R45DRAFT_1181175 [Mycena sanguinolenta]